MRIAVTGREGQVARAMAEIGPSENVTIILVGRPELDLAVAASVFPALQAARPDIVVNAAAYTAVDKAETEAALAELVNATGAGTVAEAAARLDLPVIQLSTDYVFDGAGQRPYREVDPTGPLGAYGRSKLAGEAAVAAANLRHAILRTAWVYSPFGQNFVKTMLRLAASRDEIGVVADQHGCPTSALDIARAVIAVAKRLRSPPAGEGASDLHGVFHMTGQGEAVWADVAEAIFARSAVLGGPSAAVKRIATSDYPTPARRPANSRLDGAKLAETYGITLPNWRMSLDECVARLLG
jgi:dTDP-4-dehydrorhamnose reductase